MDIIAGLIETILADVENKDLQQKIKGEVKALCQKFPLYPDRLAACS
jgi:glycine/serine hydroxymethyltransferase